MSQGPLYAQIPGQLGYQSVYIPTGNEVLPRQNPLLLMASLAENKVQKYTGNTNAKQDPIKLKFITVNTPEFQYYELDPERTRSTQLNGAIGTTDTVITVDSTDGFHAKDQIKVTSTGEVMRISAVNAGNNTITVERAFSSSLASGTTFPSSLSADTAQSASDDDYLVRLGPAMEEGSNAIYRSRKDAVRKIGHTQILRTDLIRTGTEMAQDASITIAEERYEQRKLQELAELYLDHEYIGFHGKLHRASRDGEVIRTSKGIIESITTNKVASTALASGTAQITLDDLEDIAYRVNKRGGQKVLLVGNEGFRYISKLIKETGQTSLHLEPGEKSFGISPDRIVNVFGDLKLVYYPLMDLAPYTDEIVAIDPDQLMLCALKDRALNWKDDTQQNDYDGKAGRWLTEMGLIFLNEQMHHRFTGFTFF